MSTLALMANLVVENLDSYYATGQVQAAVPLPG